MEPDFLEIIGNQYEFTNNVEYSFEHYFLEPNFDAIKSHPTCSICLNDCNPNKLRKVTSVSCGHHFHTKCINSWLAKNLHCPLCRSRCVQQSPGVKISACEYEYIIDNNVYHVNHKVNKERKWSIDCRDVNLVLEHSYKGYIREFQRELGISDVIAALIENDLDIVDAIMQLTISI